MKKTDNPALAGYIVRNYGVCTRCKGFFDRRIGEKRTDSRIIRLLREKVESEGIILPEGLCSEHDDRKQKMIRERKTETEKRMLNAFAICAVCKHLYFRQLNGERTPKDIEDSLWEIIKKYDMRLSHGSCRGCVSEWYREALGPSKSKKPWE